MPTHRLAFLSQKLLAGSVVALLLSAPAGQASAGLAPDGVVPTSDDLQLAARVIGFEDRPVSGSVRMGIVFDPGNALSLRDARIVFSLLQNGLSVGGIDLHPVLIAQDALARADRIDAVFSATGVDAVLLRRALARLHVPCLTIDRDQLDHGACMVEVASHPAVSIVLDQANADAAGVRFATAFRMMVNEQ